MCDLKKLKDNIHELREHLQQLIDKKRNFADSEVLEVSRMLDEMLVDYEKLKKKMK